MLAKWRIFYDDGRTFSNEDGPPEKAPQDGVQMLIEYDTDGRGGKHIHQGSDLYWYLGEDCWGSGSRNSFEKHERVRPPKPWVVIYGRWMVRYKYEALVAEVLGGCDGC